MKSLKFLEKQYGDIMIYAKVHRQEQTTETGHVMFEL